MTGDVGELFNAVKAERKKRRRVNKPENMRVISKSGIPHRVVNEGECILFREEGKPAVDFYPSTGRWRANGKTHNGGAVSFLKWYAKAKGET